MSRTAKHRSIGSAICILLVVPVLLACNKDPVDVEDDPLPDADLRVLFIGNSLTYTNRLPDMVKTIAEATGHTMAVGMVALPNVSLEDHWLNGIEQTILSVKADVVVMQQGPSSLPQNQEYLRAWTEILADPIRAAGGEPALCMVWPDITRVDAFGAVYQSYLGAANAVNGILIPAGLAWVHSWELDPELQLYGSDGFHPSDLGTAVAALTIFRVLFNEDVSILPDRFVPVTPSLPIVDLGPGAPFIRQAVETAVEAAGVGIRTK
ncbi:MAG: SGNH/GDSL hydrolase family protein [Gemmatimonadetes bacterium]|nr:SGNH/GDSL hydrolase family protein [Gemmatimonadota bacterium]